MRYRVICNIQVDRRDYRAGEVYEPGEDQTIAAEQLLGLGAIERMADDALEAPIEYHGGGGPADPASGGAPSGAGDAGKASGSETPPAAVDPAVTAGPTAGLAEVSREGAETGGAAASTVKASEQPAVPSAAGRRGRNLKDAGK